MLKTFKFENIANKKLESLREVRRDVSGIAQNIWCVRNVRVFEWNFDTLQALQLVSGFLLNRQQVERF